MPQCRISNAARTDIVGILRLSQTQADASAHKFQTKKSHSSEWLFSESWSGKRDSHLVSDPLNFKGFIFLPEQEKT